MNNEGDIQRTLSRIEGKLDALGITMSGHSAQDDVRFANLEKELRGLQQSKWMLFGGAATVSSIMTSVLLWFRGH